MQHYYIYYRIDPQFEAEAAAAVNQIQFELAAECSVQGRRLQKRGEPQLWMEIYENVAAAAAFESQLEKAVEKTGFARFLQAGSTRKAECFQG